MKEGKQKRIKNGEDYQPVGSFYHKSKQGPSLLCIQANEVRLIKKSPECYRLTRESEQDVCKPKKFTVVNNLYKQQVRGNESCRDFNFYKEN